MSAHLLDTLAEEIDKLLGPIAGAVENPYAFDRLLAEVGAKDLAVVVGDDRETLVAALSAVAGLRTQIEAIAAQPAPSLESIAALFDLSRQALEAVRALSGFGAAGDVFADLGEDLAVYLLASYMRRWHPLAHSLLSLATLIEPAHEQELRLPVVQGDEMIRNPFSLDRFRFGRLVDLIRDPAATLRAEYGSPSDNPVGFARKLFPRLQSVLRTLGVPCRYGFDEDNTESLGDTAPYLEDALIIYAQDVLAGAAAEAGVVLNPSPVERGDLGLVISPFGTLTTTKEVGGWSFDMNLTGGVDVVAYGRHGLTLLADSATTEVQGSLAATLPAPEQGPAYLLGSPDGSRLEIGGAQLKLETALSEERQSLALSADVSSSKLVIAPGDGDGFLSSILPAEGVEAEFDLGLAWSNERGLTLRGSGSLEATLPVNLSIRDVLRIPTVHVGLQASDAGLSAEVSAAVGLSLGPVKAVVDRVGIKSEVTFPETGGNLGAANLNFRFKPPNGVGLSIDTSSVSGGGFLSLDADKGQYAGIVQLNLRGDIAVKGVGLIATRLPDGSKGYSLLVLITAEGFKPVPLPLGFKLTGIGGLLALNRTFDQDVLRSGLKNHTLDSVMFPKDPIRNAPQILSNLNKVFPAARGHHLFGPVVQISWGTPPVITANVALVLEFGARLRLLLLAQIEAILPKRENDLIRLQMDAVGILDFDQGTASLDACLHDSRLLKKFVLTGDMAMRLKWEGAPNFALAVGGLHPAFNPPPAFPKLERITINLAAGDNPRIRCEAYFALTSNTVQFGARAELYASAAGFSIHGDVGFDVLIQFDPFAFLADFHAQLQLKRGSTNLFKVRFEGSLSGPRPLHIKGKATFEVLWWDVTIRIDKTLVAGAKPPLPEPINVMPRLLEALGNSGNWVSQFPGGQGNLVTLRPVVAGPTDVLLHPLGSLTVKQNIVPLNMDISKFGHAAPAGARRFSITRVTFGDQSQDTQPVRDFFAPAQFFELNDDEKLSRPSFESMAAGVGFTANNFAFTTEASDWLEVEAIAFETLIVDKEQNQPRPSNPDEPKIKYTLRPELLGKQALFGAAGSSDLRRAGKAKYRTTGGKNKVAKEGWSIVSTDDLTERPVPGLAPAQPASYSEAAEALRKLKRENPAQAAGLKIMRRSELSESVGVDQELRSFTPTRN